MDREKRLHASSLRGSTPAVRTPALPIVARPWGKKACQRLLRVLAWLAAAVGAAVGAAIVVAAVVVHRFEAGLPSVRDLKAYRAPQVTRILARDGTTVLAELFTQRRTVVPLDSLPAHVKLATLAAEDADFYEHEGLNYLGIARAFLVNLRARSTRQGGSTITQQVVKNLLLGTSERTLGRKIREALLARRLERELTKDDILELYLNNIYFGRGRFGIEEAARDDFGKSARFLSIGEAALLVGRIANPREYHPRTNMASALTRRAYVLDQMHAKGFLSDAAWALAKSQSVTLGPLSDGSSGLAPEAVELAKAALYKLEPDQARLGGFTVTTSIDPALQAAARKAVRDGLLAYDKRHGIDGALRPPPRPDKKGRIPAGHDGLVAFEGSPSYDQHRILVGIVTGADDVAATVDVRVGTRNGTVKLSEFPRYNQAHLAASEFAPVGAYVRVSLSSVPSDDLTAKLDLRLESGPEGVLVALDARTRQILALVGSFEGTPGGLDRSTQSKRQPGSTFKPIVYSYALHSRKVTAASLIDPTPEVFEGGYKPTNFEGWQGRDPLRLREALANSVNVAAVRALRDIGPANVVAWARELGIESPMKPDLSLALGSYEVRPLELAGAYATFAAGGVYEEPTVVLRVVGPDGQEVQLPAHAPSRRVMDEGEAFLVTSLLTSVVDHGTGSRARSLGRPLAGKTGTTNGPKDAWFAGYSPDVVAVTWVGYDDGRWLGSSEQGAVTALPAWMAFMKVATDGKPRVDFSRPPGIATVTIDKRTGALPYAGDPDILSEYFLPGTEPTDVAVPPSLDGGS
ncbi:MAG: PBP1A family penicillin-binding protein [Polyangiaceae bacterium]|jgi:penicillin-binding protein 1A